MGSTRERLDIDGKLRYIALYRDAQGRQRSAGTYTTEKQAEKASTKAESLLEIGRLTDTRTGRQRFADYVTKTWLPHHELERTTRQRYVYSIEKYLLPEFGGMKMAAIRPAHVRAWITKLKDADVSASTINDLKTILSAIFTTALNDQIVPIHPCRGVKTPTVARKPRTIITAEQFDQIHAALPNDTARLLVELAIESGLRWGELTELRPADLNLATYMLTVSRAAIEVNARFRDADDPPFEVKAYPKDKEFRRLKLTPELVEQISRHIDAHSLHDRDLLFPIVLVKPSDPIDTEEPYQPPEEGVDLGRTEPNRAGRTYRHGTLTGYSLGSCRCRHCRHAYATYRANRRANGKDDPRTGRTINTDGHLPRRWFSKYIWKPTLHNAGLRFNVRFHDLRHAHASWLLAGGADLQAVKERLGHGSLRTTEKYLHTLPDTDNTALNAYNRIRNRNRNRNR